MQKTVLLFGAGKSATALITYLINEASANNWKIVLADTNKELILSKTNNSPFVQPVEINVRNDEQRSRLISTADIVISLMPPSLHFLIARDCIAFNKNLLTASYIDEQIKNLEADIKKKDLLFLCEMGLDPGIDHMSAMQLIDSIRAKGSSILSFKSHCGGLTAPENDNNPWHYKISWNPKNVVMAGKAGAVYKTDGMLVAEKYEELFDSKRTIKVPGLGMLSYYPNRDSRTYIDLYGLQDAKTFVRTTLRHPEFMLGWKNLIDLKLTDETKEYNTDNLSLLNFFKKHLSENGFENWLKNVLAERINKTKELLEGFEKIMDADEQPEDKAAENFMIVDEEGKLTTLESEDMITANADIISSQIHEANLILNQLFYLGLDDKKTIINKGVCNACDILQFVLETKLALQPGDKDMVVMLHELTVNEAGKTYNIQSSMIVKGDDDVNTAMAKTVGLPLGIAAKLILNGVIQLKGLHIPVVKEIYQPVLEELRKNGVSFTETIS